MHAAGRHVMQADPDTDGDGLPDFQEVHKYCTDPKKSATADDVPDGQWQQRREFTYSIRAVIRVMRPYNLAALSDDYQDARVLRETDDYGEFELIVYPLNTNAEAITGNPHWKNDDAGMRAYLASGITTNWDNAMRTELLRELAQDGIDPERMTDKEVVEQVSRWLYRRSKSPKMFCTMYVGFPNGRPTVLPGLEEAFARDRGDPSWTVQQEFEHELWGKAMFAHKTHGSCTSTAIYETTVLRALGIPTRIILCIAVADASDPAQLDLVEKGLTHNQIRHDVYQGVSAGHRSFSAHSFCEVFVGGRWRRLNWSTLGQNVIQPRYLGLMIKVHTFNDLSEARLAETWGTRYARHLRDEAFPYANPYRLLEISDHFGKYATLSNPSAADPSAVNEHHQLTIDKVYWADAPDAPAKVRQMKSKAEPGGHNLWIHCRERFQNAGGYLQYKPFMRQVDHNFVLQAEGQSDVACRLSMSFTTSNTENLCEMELVIPPEEYAKMATDVAYTLQPLNSVKDYVWKIREGLALRR
jgi:hypothetical protein